MEGDQRSAISDQELRGRVIADGWSLVKKS